MVFGNMGDDSGTGVAFTRDPNTGEKVLFGEYLTNAQGEDVVAGIRTAPKIAQMQTDMPEVYAEFQRIGQQLERTTATSRTSSSRSSAAACTCSRRGPRSGPRPPPCKIAADMVDEGTITKEEAIARIEPAHVDQLLRDHVRPARRSQSATKIVNGLNASPGAAVGRAVFDADTAVEWVEPRREGRSSSASRRRPTTSTAWPSAQGIITARGGATSHAAVVARQIGKPCVAGSARPAGRLRRASRRTAT